MLTFFKKAIFNYNQIRLVFINLGLGIEWDYLHISPFDIKNDPHDTP